MSDGPAEPSSRRPSDVEAYCAVCYRIEVVRYALPPTCPQCGAEAPWRRRERPDPAWVLSVMDRRLLKGLRISPE